MRPGRLKGSAPWLGAALFGLAAGYQIGRSDRKKAEPGESHASEPGAAAEPGRGRQARRLRDIPLAGWKGILWRTFKEMSKDRLSVVAGGVTFYALLSLVPMMSAFVSVYGLLADVDAVRDHLAQLSRIMPPGALSIVSDQMIRLTEAERGALGLAFAVSLAVALWSAGAGVNALIDGLNIAFGEAEERSWIRRRLLVTAMTVAAIVFFAAMSALLIAAPLAIKARYGLIPEDFWWVPFRWLLAAGVVAAAIGLLYRYGPSRTPAKVRWVWLGGVVAAVGWLGGSLVYSAIIGQVTDFEARYGALGAVIGFMLWVWFSAMIVLLCAELTAEIEHQTAVDTTVGPPAPMGARGAEMADTLGEKFEGFGKGGGKRQARKMWGRLRATPP